MLQMFPTTPQVRLITDLKANVSMCHNPIGHQKCLRRTSSPILTLNSGPQKQTHLTLVVGKKMLIERALKLLV